MAFLLVLAAQLSYAQQIDLVGQWHMVNIKHVTNGQTRSMEDEHHQYLCESQVEPDPTIYCLWIG